MYLTQNAIKNRAVFGGQFSYLTGTINVQKLVASQGLGAISQRPSYAAERVIYIC